MKAKVALGLLIPGVALLALGLYLAPSDAYPVQRVFRAHGKPLTARVQAKRMHTVRFEAAGDWQRSESYQERTVDVLLPDARVVSVDQLVLASDYDRLQVGDEVPVTVLAGDEALRELPGGPYYLLSSSVDATPTQLLGWAFSGRPASGKAIAAGIPGVILLLVGGAFLYEALRRRR